MNDKEIEFKAAYDKKYRGLFTIIVKSKLDLESRQLISLVVCLLLIKKICYHIEKQPY